MSTTHRVIHRLVAILHHVHHNDLHTMPAPVAIAMAAVLIAQPNH